MIEVRGKWSVVATAMLFAACLPLNACGDDAADAGVATVKAKELPGYGPVLVTADEQPLYLLTSDPKGSTACTGACTEEWQPLAAEGEPAAGAGAKEDLLATFARGDGGSQVLYNGHALYTYARPNAGMGAGAGVKWQDGTWYLVSPEGEAIKTTAVGGY